MNQAIVGFHKDAEGHWVADLQCGHGQHMRHDPPWMERPWVLTEEGRNSRLGERLSCKRCEDFGQQVARAVLAECRKQLIDNYEDAGLSGLCAEGRWEVAVGSLEKIDIKNVLLRIKTI